ncbi:hypothetical protein CTI12_AA580930 [Artemisia annua]|uniref:Uncharacterized protein n=1 Tax=Artemisia annua TaxID=35608 RepID=A0A2U1KNZ9_ARTAN|nr:hypothetical protein CTI12_AA580930 [Artemisia annua]
MSMECFQGQINIQNLYNQNAVNTSVPYPSQGQHSRRPTVNNPPLPPQRQFTNHLNPNIQSQINSNPSPQSQQYRPPTVNNPPLPPQPQFTNHLNTNVQSQVSSNPFPDNLQYPVSHLVPPSSSQPQMASSQPSYTVPAQSRTSLMIENMRDGSAIAPVPQSHKRGSLKLAI